MQRLRKSGALHTVKMSPDRCRHFVERAFDKIQTYNQHHRQWDAFGAVDHSSGSIEMVSPGISFKIGDTMTIHVANVLVEETSFGKGMAKIVIDCRRHIHIVVPISACHKPY